MSQLPFIFDGACMLCKNKPPPSEMLTCGKCTTPDGDWFLYTGSGGRDLTGNKRTNKIQSFDHKFQYMNEALKLSCTNGYPVRVVRSWMVLLSSAYFSVIRSHKEQRSPYAPESGLRYDGVYRIEKCWRINGIQGYQVCRYLFVRCDNEPAPWTSDEHGDRPRPLPEIAELNGAEDDITGRKGNPSWDYDNFGSSLSGGKGVLVVEEASPKSKKSVHIKSEDETTVRVNQKVENVSVNKSLSNEFCCQICLKVMSSPLTTPCAYNFCKTCLEGAFAGQSFIRNRACLQNPQVNRVMMGTIESLQHQEAEQDENSEKSSDKNDKNLHDAAEVSNPCEKVLEEIKDFDLNKPPK